MRIDIERLAACLDEPSTWTIESILADIAAQGFVIVPREPTEAIVEAACRAEAKHQGFDYDAVSIGEIRTAMESCGRVWRFLIDAGKDHANG